MKRLAFAMAFVCALVPARAGANTGGWWEMIYGLDPKLMGFGTDLHLICLNPGGSSIGDRCEELWGLRLANDPSKLKDIRHEFNIRFAYFWEYGTSYESNILQNAFNADSMHAVKVIPMYVYHADKHISVGVGAGWMPFWGDKPSSAASSDTSFGFSKFIVTPLSLTYSPATVGFGGFFVRGEGSYIKKGVSPHDFEGSRPNIDRAGEWSVSFSAGFDLRRR